MGELMDLEPHFSPEQDAQSHFVLESFNASSLSDGEYARRKAATTTLIKESIQNFTHLDDDVRSLREVSTRGDYIWTILNDLAMVKEELPTKLYRETYASAHDKAVSIKADEREALWAKYEEHPVLDYLQTLLQTASQDRLTSKEIAILQRSALVLLDEYSQ